MRRNNNNTNPVYLTTKHIEAMNESELTNYLYYGTDDINLWTMNESLNEGVTGGENGILNRLKEISKKGLLTGMILMSVLPNLSASGRETAKEIGKESGIEVVMDDKVEEPHLLGLRVFCESPSGEGGFKEAVKKNKQKMIKTVVDYCAKIGESDAELVYVRNTGNSQWSRATRKEGNGKVESTLETSYVGSVFEVYIRVSKDYGNDIVQLKGE